MKSILQYTRTIANYHETTPERQVVPTSVIEKANPFWISLAKGGELHDNTNYEEHRVIPNRYQLWTRAMNNTLPVTPEK